MKYWILTFCLALAAAVASTKATEAA